MESWMVSLGIAVTGAIAAFAVTRHLVSSQGAEIKALKEAHKSLRETEVKELKTFKDEKLPLLNHLSRAEDFLKEKTDKQSEDIVFLKEKVNNAATMKEVRIEFVSKELFLAMEKHIDSRFGHLEKSMDKGFESVVEAIDGVK